MIADIERHRRDLDELCRRFGVRRLALFGSATRELFDAHSDLDFLVEFKQPLRPGYADRYFGLLEGLQSLFGRPVDLVVDSAITNPYFRESVNETQTVLYAA